MNERHGEILIERAVNVTAAASAFSYDPMLRTASLAPPPPFSGRAHVNLIHAKFTGESNRR